MQHRKAAYLNIGKIFTSTEVYHFKFENSTHAAQFTPDRQALSKCLVAMTSSIIETFGKVTIVVT